MNKDNQSNEIQQKKILELHERIAELEKLESSRRETNNGLQKIEEKIQRLFKEEKDTIAIIQDRIIKYVNPSVTRLIGYTPEEMIGTSFADYIHPDELPKVAKYYIQRIAGEDVPPVYRTRVRHKDGREVHIEIKASTVTYKGKLADFTIVEEIDKK
jgi:PAS domain S-box-containing protein